MSNAFAIVNAHELSLRPGELSSDQRWLVRGRALEDVKLGDSFSLGAGRVTVETICSYGKNTDLLSAGMTGDLTVRWAKDKAMLTIVRRPVSADLGARLPITG